MDRRSTATLICDWAGCCDLARPQAPGPFEREQRLRKHGRWCAGICGNSLLQAAEAGLQLVGTELSGKAHVSTPDTYAHRSPAAARVSLVGTELCEQRKGAHADHLAHVTAGAAGRLLLPTLSFCAQLSPDE